MTERTAFITARPIAHRGLHDLSRGIVENTASAFAGAIAGGYAIECDLQLTRDGEAVVFHDDHLERLTEGRGMVKDLTVADMKGLAIRRSLDRVQTLGELLAQVQGQVPLVIEIKSHWDGDQRLAARTLEVLESYRGPHCLMSFDPDVVEALRRMSPGTIRGIVAERAFDSYYDALPFRTQMELRCFSHISRTQLDDPLCRRGMDGAAAFRPGNLRGVSRLRCSKPFPVPCRSPARTGTAWPIRRVRNSIRSSRTTSSAASRRRAAR